MTARELTVGSDVEFFLSHNRAGVIPATSYNTPGTKLNPIALGEGTFHRDNISVEIQPPPANTPEEFVENNYGLHQELTNVYKQMHIDLVTMAACEFTEEMVDCNEAKEIGCEPDMCAYSGKSMPPSNATLMATIRTGSGHIHLGGVDDLTEALRAEVVKHLDHIEGPILAIEDYDMDHLAYMRRMYYGQAGRFRLKPYGLEWRTPSSLNWYSYVYRGNAARLFGSLHAAVALVDAGITVNDLVPPSLTTELRKAIDATDIKGIRRLAEPVKGAYTSNEAACNIIEKEVVGYDYPGIYAV